MKVRWLGNSTVEIKKDKTIHIDPNPTIKPSNPDIILITHEHDDHYNPNIKPDNKTDIYAPKTTLKKFNLEGAPVKPGDTINNIKVLQSSCWKSKESVSYYINGLLHTGDSNKYPKTPKKPSLLFTACFPDNYQDYINQAQLHNPELVIPYHYNPKTNKEDAEGLKKRLENKNINCKIIKPGTEIKI